TNKEPERFGMSGQDRALLYRLAVETGLRAGELRSLTRASFNFDSNPPTVTVLAGYSKRRREDTLPLRPDVAACINHRFGNRSPAATVFKMPNAYDVIDMLRADLASARNAWIRAAKTPQEQQGREESSFLAYRDDAGRVADFHSFRHSFITN